MKFQILQIQQNYLTSSQDTSELAYLQRNSCTKLQEFKYNKKSYYHSIDDKYQDLRIVTFSFLVHIYHRFTPMRQLLLNKFKRIIYSSSLSLQMTVDKGIKIQTLRKYFAEAMKALNSGDVSEEAICSIINCSSFIDKIILVALEAHISEISGNTDIKKLISANIFRWFKQQFDMEIVLNKTGVQQQKELQLFLVMDENRLIRESYNQEMEDVQIDTDSEIFQSKRLKTKGNKRKENYLAISTSAGPMVDKKSNASSSFSQNTSHQQNVKPNQSSPLIEIEVVRKRNRSGFFDLFFCCSE